MISKIVICIIAFIGCTVQIYAANKRYKNNIEELKKEKVSRIDNTE